MNTLRDILAASLVMLTMSCSNDDYLNVIPMESIAIASIDLMQNQSPDECGIGDVLKDIIGFEDITECGLDISSKIYAFETPDGTIGLVARVENADDVTKQFVSMYSKGKCTSPEQHRGNTFVLIDNSWLAGYSDEALIVIGPITSMQRVATEQKMQKMFRRDDGNDVRESKMFMKLDSINAPVSIVARMSALPEKLILPFTLGMPKEADLSQIILSVGMNHEDGMTVIHGKTFSFNRGIDIKLKENDKIFRNITDDMLDNLPSNSLCHMFMNAEGNELLKVMQQNRSTQVLLVGANTVVDMDNILRSVNGNIVFSFPNLDGDFYFKARLHKKDFLADVGYWKLSCPAGSKMIDAGKDTYVYINDDVKFCFSVSSDNIFISSLFHGSTDNDVRNTSYCALPEEVKSKVVGSKLAMLFNTDKIRNETFAGIMRSLSGGTTKIMYIKE